MMHAMGLGCTGGEAGRGLRGMVHATGLGCGGCIAGCGLGGLVMVYAVESCHAVSNSYNK